MAPRIVTLPIANIAIANTTTDLVTRVQTIVDYLNNTPIGNVVSTAGGPILLDDIAGRFTGSQTVFTLTSSGAAVNVGTPENLLITLNGTVQDTPDAYSATGGTLTFVDAPYPGTTFYGVIMVSNGATGSGTSDTANNALHLVGKHEAELNVNLALTSNNATYAYGKTEGNLNVNNATYAYGKTEGNLNVNSAVNANNANSIGGNAVRTGIPANADVLTWDTANGYWMPAVGGAGGPHNVLSSTHSDSNTASASRGDIITAQGASPLWSRLTVGTAGQALTSNGTEPGWAAKVNAATDADTANNATHAFGKHEGDLNVNLATTANTANNATNAFGKTEGNLNVNSALLSNNSTYLNGNAASNFVLLTANNNFTGANNYFGGNVFVSHLGANTAPHANAVAKFGGQYGSLLNAAGNLGATPTFDFNLSNEFYGTMTANATFTLSNPIDGHRYCLLINSGAGGFWITWPAACLWGAGGAPGNSLGAGLVDMFTFIYVAATAKYYMSYALGY